MAAGLAATVTIVVAIALAFHAPKSTPEPPASLSKITTSKESTHEVEPVDLTSCKDWSPDFNAIRAKLSKLPSSVAKPLNNEIKKLSQLLESREFASDSIESLAISESLETIRTEIPTVEAKFEQSRDFVMRLDLSTRQLQENVVSVAVADVRQEFSQLIHSARRDLSETRDQIAIHNDEIARSKREFAETANRTARAKSLEVKMSKIDDYLSAFTSPGHLQPVSNSNPWHTKRTAEALPVSLSALERLGALEPTMEGYERLYKFGGGKNPIHNNGRPLRCFPEYASGYLHKPNVLIVIKQAQQLLRDHGDALVEAKLLSP